MAKFNTEDLYNRAVKAIEKHELIFIDDIIAFLPCSKQTFYEYIKADSNELDELKELLYENRVVTKVALRKKWKDSDNATLQMGLYKLTGTDEERRRLSQTHHDLTTNGKEIDNTMSVEVIPPTKDD